MLAGAVVLVAVLRAWPVPYYALTPGDATPVAPLVKIQGLPTNPHRDKIMLTDVYLSTLTAWQWLIMHFESHVEFVSADQLVEPGIAPSELLAQGFLQMFDSKQSAQVAAFRALGWTIPATTTGAVVNGVVAPSPAHGAKVHVADKIVGANGRVVDTSCSLIDIVHVLRPGSLVHLNIERSHINARGDISYSKAVVVSLRTAVAPRALVGNGCAGLHGPDRSWIGVSLEDGWRYVLPGAISINTSYIGGPSAGLAMSLTLIDELSSGSLTGHRTIAATGTIDARGHVGDVGGVAEKTVAVQRAGATIFLVPRVEVATARAAAQPGLRILGVTTLQQALHDLHALGGVTPVSLATPH